ncbi:ABC transporter substrate binding protein [Pontibacterium granulatum]|uniref:ABC transporter substrate-binding protein n=1 Tax=Pontibacterium granulatum TaxID=2036029 RepID=UPI00249AAD87|nr:ABC transporter substrate binding protein [Pontibacterium granulatum]MDI3324272.1 ABC transporter substrate binding protein [Pontibacterium granulatum]
MLLGLFLPGLVLAADTLAVIYPEAPPPYKQVFDQIVEGIEARHTDRLLRYPLEKNYSRTYLLSQLEADRVDMVVTLGRRGYSLIGELSGKYPLVSGALPLTPANTVPGVSLIADPDTLFSQLRNLSPTTQRIFVLFTDKSRWMVELAQKSAAKKGFELKAQSVNSLSDAVRAYQAILDGAQAETDAIWLPLDKVTSNETVILPMLLREAWDRRLVLFSSKPSHVKRGTLFSIYPNNQQSGERLAEMVKELYLGRAAPGVEPSRSQNVGVNLRTAVHLGLEYSPSLTRSFYRTFPQP